MKKISKFLISLSIFGIVFGGFFGVVNKAEAACQLDGNGNIIPGTCSQGEEGSTTSDEELLRNSCANKTFYDNNKATCQKLTVGTSGASQKSDLTDYGVAAGCFGLTEFNPSVCVATFAQLVYIPSSWALMGAGKIFNKLLVVTMSKKVLDLGFVSETWKALRDIANMLFIIILVIVSISIILDMGDFSNTKIIGNIILIALVINFSLFLTRVVIDAGNVTALGFYDALTVSNKQETSAAVGEVTTKFDYGITERDVSGGLVKSFNPAKLIAPESFKNWREEYVTKKKGSETTANLMLAFVFILAAGLNFYAAYLFFIAAFIFITRVGWLWVLMFSSPLAFIAFTIPKLSGKFKSWWNKLFNMSFSITVFLFWMWLILIIVGSDFMKSAFDVVESGSFNFTLIEFLVIIFMQYMILISLLKMALKSTEDMAGSSIGHAVFDAGKSALGLAGFATGGALVGAALKGGAGVMARGTVGKLASSATSAIEERQKQGKMTGFVGRWTLKGTKGMESAKFGLKEGYKQQVERVAGEEKAMVNRIKSIKLPSGAVTTDRTEIEKEFYRRRQAGVRALLGGSVATTGVTAAILPGATLAAAPLMTPVMMAVNSRRGGEKKALKDYKDRKKLEGELNTNNYIVNGVGVTGNKGELKQLNIELGQLNAERKIKEAQQVPASNPAMIDVIDRIEKKKNEIDKKKSEISKKEEEIKKLKG